MFSLRVTQLCFNNKNDNKIEIGKGNKSKRQQPDQTEDNN